MRNLFTILFLFCSYLSSCQKVIINGSGGRQVTINDTGNAPIRIIETFGQSSPLVPIEYKLVGSDTASAIYLSIGDDEVSYTYLDPDGTEIGTGEVSVDTDQSFFDIKADVFTSLGLDDLLEVDFQEPAQNTEYVAFGNLIKGPPSWPYFHWLGMRGTGHLNNGRLVNYPYNSANRTFGTRVVLSRTLDGSGVRGGSACVINDSIHYFYAVYLSSPNTFTALCVTKSADGVTWTAEDTLLFVVGSNGGIDETTFDRFNFYGKPKNKPGTQTWYIPWYEHQSSVTWRVNYLYTENNFATWENVNVSESTVDQIGETDLELLGGDTILLLGRPDLDAPLEMNLSFDAGATWQGWQTTNLGAGLDRAMASVIYTPEHGIVVVYGDRGTGNIMLSKNNAISDIVASPTAWNSPTVIYNTDPEDATYRPLGYPSIIRVAQYRYMIAFSKEYTSGNARLLIGDGRLP